MQTNRSSRLSRIVLLACSLSACADHDPLAPSYAVSRGAPAAPTNLTVTATSYSEIVLAWEDNATNDAGVEVYRSTSEPTSTFTLFTTYPWPNLTGGGNGGLQPSTQYCYRVRAFSTQGGSGKVRAYSAFSNTACATTPGLPVPATPSGVHASPDFGSRIRVVWVDNATNENGHRVERSATADGPWTNLGTTGPNVLLFDDWSAPALELPVCYRVVAFNNFGDSPASNVACTARPAPPSGLVAIASGSDVDLTWTDNSNVEDGYSVQRWTDESGASVITIVAELPVNATAYHDAGLSDGKYWYQVRARKDGGRSGGTNNASAMILTMPPVAPGFVDAYPGSSSVATVAYVDQSTNESGFRVERSMDGGLNWVSAGEVSAPPSYPPPSFTTFGDGGQPSEQQLCYRVIAFNSLGESPPSNTDCTMLPLGPTSLTATGVSPQTIDLAWIDNSAIEDGYEVYIVVYYCSYYDEWGYCVFEPYFEWIATLGPNVTSFQHTGLIQGDTRTYFVVALKDGGRSDASNEAVGTAP